ncbi:helix-turn-helix domain-containing protein [Streptomyces canus]|uniref:helix-turn-helix domain-containing protein n=1 Tax=Streptomyces canus TaxID=58343 RepID=UPI0032514EC5
MDHALEGPPERVPDRLRGAPDPEQQLTTQQPRSAVKLTHSCTLRSSTTLQLERQAFREHIRLQAAGLFAMGRGSAKVAKELRVSVRSVQRWRRAWEQGGEHGSSSTTLDDYSGVRCCPFTAPPLRPRRVRGGVEA